MAGRPRLTLVPGCGMSLRTPPLGKQRPKVIVKVLDAIDRGVGNVSSRKSLEPVVLDPPIRSVGDSPKADLPVLDGPEKVVGLLEKGHGAILGNVFPVCQGALSPKDGKAFLMRQKRPLPRQVLARNLAALQKKAGLTGHEIARRAKVDPKTVNNQLHGKYDPRPEQVDAVASVFGLTYLDLLNPGFDPAAQTNDTMRQLVQLYSMADDTGRKNILAVAEMAVGYRPEDVA
jgi:transcriptional regulator with XRE-family HTH domain